MFRAKRAANKSDWVGIQKENTLTEQISGKSKAKSRAVGQFVNHQK
jgi:hypothetical protein